MLVRLGAGGLIGILFSAIGLISLAVAGALYLDLSSDRASREHVVGTVVEQQKQCRKGCSYRPVVEYVFAGERYRTIGVVGNSSPVFDVGEQVELLVPARDPRDARIDHWTESGFGILFGLGFFVIFGGIGLPSLYKWRRGVGDAQWARAQGAPVKANLVGVEKDTRIKVNGRSPYVIVAQWQNPRDGKVYRFTSQPTWLNPSLYLKDRTHVDVRVDPAQPRRYWMDTGFLPESG
ncbi:MAG TPA: DUF3592 domain-containing protein [Verrucomicrobiae bacterium]|nr:DUF3592 domain-containing protein [Verrucomicrobiae bacterium]